MEYIAPEGLLGLTSTIALVLSVIKASAFSIIGYILASVSSGILFTPAICNHIWWLKYHGVGMITSSFSLVKDEMLAQKA